MVYTSAHIFRFVVHLRIDTIYRPRAYVHARTGLLITSLFNLFDSCLPSAI